MHAGASRRYHAIYAYVICTGCKVIFELLPFEQYMVWDTDI